MPCHITGQNLTQNANSQPKQSPKISPNKDILDNSSFPPGDLSGEQQTEEPEKIKSDHNLGDTEDGDIDEEITVNFLDSEDVNNEEELKDLGESVQSPQSDSKSNCLPINVLLILILIKMMSVERLKFPDINKQ